MRWDAFIVVAVVCVVPACRPLGENAFTRLHGDWQMVAATDDGVAVPADALQGKIWRFTGNQLIPLDNQNDVGTLALDDTEDPAIINITDKAGTVDKGIYQLTGGKLTMAFGSDGQRPRKFNTSRGGKMKVIVLERIKK